jgi:hypothetical protein
MHGPIQTRETVPLMSHQISCKMENTELVPGEILNDVRGLKSHAHCRVQGIRGQLVLVNVFRPAKNTYFSSVADPECLSRIPDPNFSIQDPESR